MPQSLVPDVARLVNLLWIDWIQPIFNECFIEPIIKIYSMDTKAYTQSPSSKLSRIYIGKLTRYICILLIVIVPSSSPIEK
jgi:hypothetical protein